MSLRKQAASGVKWMGISAGAANALLFAQRVLLARLLVPADFGLAGMIFVVVGFADAFADFGLGTAIIQRKNVTSKDLSSLYWFNILSGFLIFVLIIAGAPWIAALFGQQRLLKLLPLAALNFLIVPFGQQFQVLLQREMLFDRLAKIEVGAQLVGTVAAVSFALAGGGVYALVWGLLFSSGTRTILLMALGWRRWAPSLYFSPRGMRGYLRFGAYRMADFGAFYFATNIDAIVIGRYLGPSALGIYSLALQLVVWPLTKINPIISRVAFPVLSKLQDDDAALRRGLLEMIKLLATFLFPLLAALGASAPWLIPFVFGAKWAPAVVILQLLIPVGVVKTLVGPVAQVLLAKGYPEISFAFTLTTGITNAVAYWLVIGGGPSAIALTNAVLNLLFLPLGIWLVCRVIDLRPAAFVKAIWLPTIMSLLLGFGLYGSYVALSPSGLGHEVLLMSLWIAGLLLYLALAWRLDRDHVRRVSALFIGAR